MTAAVQTYVQVLLPVKLRWIPTYASTVPLEPGRRVSVELGRRRYDGVVWRSLERPDLPPERIQPILSVQDDLPRVTEQELRFWEFLADYYLCTLGEVYKAAYPHLKIRSEQTAADILARLHVFHSGKTPVARRRAAEALRQGGPAVILGTRSALFLPFRDLGLVIVDEEQDPSYKQTEPAPRYHGRDAAVALAGIHGARVLLGAAVPSLETLLNVRTGKYGLRETGAPPAAATVIDIPAERRKNGMVGPFSRKLIAAVQATEGPVVLLRGWENQDPLREEAARLFPGRDIRIQTLGALKREGADDAALLAVLQADAFIARDDFRGDERALQLVGTLCQFAPQVLIQTAVPARFSGARSPEDLLAERRQFGFPPYTRLVEVRRQGSAEIRERHFLQRDKTLATRKAELLAHLSDDCYLDVDPLD